MTLDDYQQEAQQTASYSAEIEKLGIPTVVGKIISLNYSALGLAGEAGEVANKVKKIIRDDGSKITALKRKELKNELGDVLWYCAAVATELGLSLDDVAQLNLDKLRKRKEEGVLSGSGDYR